jgi:cytochrome c556
MKTRLIIIAVLLSMFCTSCIVVEENGHRHRRWGHRH